MNDRSLILEQDAEPISFSPNALVGECSWGKIFSELQVLLEQLGFVYFTYSSVPKDLGGSDSQFALSKRRYGADTQGSLPEGIVSRYYKEMATKDPLWDVLPRASQAVIIQSNHASTTPVVDSFWEKYDVQSRVYIPVGYQEHTLWFNYFGLYHRLPNDEFVALYRRISGSLIPLLERCHKLLLLDGAKETNPYICHAIFSVTCRDILRMTADGMSVKIIANQLSLTEEGVTYHITRAKRVLQARNKTHLIALLYQSGIL